MQSYAEGIEFKGAESVICQMSCLVPREGVEPTRPCGHGILSVHSFSAIVLTALESYLLENEWPGELLGAILIELKMITQADLRSALAIQKEKTPA